MDKKIQQIAAAVRAAPGTSATALFAGDPAATTRAAESLATSLALTIYRVNLAQIVSKNVGETEKNIDRVFSDAAKKGTLLVFVEADALFGKRTGVKDSHDRYVNTEMDYLLKRMESFQGLSILTSNLRSNVDEAFKRRLRYFVELAL